MLIDFQQNKNTVCFWGRAVSVFCACTLLFLLMAVPPAFAFASDFAPIVQSDSPASSSNGTNIGSNNYGTPIYVNASTSSVYGFYYPRSASDTRFYTYLISSDPFTYYSGSTFYDSSYIQTTDGYYYTGNIGQVVVTASDAFPLFSSFSAGFEAFKDFSSSSSGNAKLIPYYQSFDLYVGLNSSGQSVYLRSYYPNNAAVAISYEDGSYWANIIGLDQYGVSSVINGVEAPLSRSDYVVDGVTYSSYYLPSLSSPSSAFSPFSNSVAASQACIELLDSTKPVPGEKTVLYFMPSGNMAFVQVSERTSIALLQTTFNGAVPSSDFSSFNFRYGWASSLPSDGSLPSVDSLTPVPWTGFGKKNLYGQFTSAQANIDFAGHAGDYLIVFNPWTSDYLRVSPDTTATLNPDIMINVDHVTRMKVYGLSQSIDPSTGDYTNSPSGNESELDVNTPYDNVWTDPDGNISPPVQGGGGNVSPVTSFWNWLNSQFDSLKSLFATGHDTIQTLVGYGSDFMTSLMALYSWLPPAVFSVLQSALIVVIIVGVVKVFL